MDQDLRQALQQAYSQKVSEREDSTLQPWKREQRQKYLEVLQARQATSLLEIGSGTGKDAAFFAEHGLEVLASDLTPANVEACRQKGLQAEVMDVCALPLPDAGYEAAYSMNCLLHLPKAEFPTAMAEVRRVLKPGGLFYLGLYGGHDSEAIFEQDRYEPKRLFSFWSSEALRAAVSDFFSIVDFEIVELRDTELKFLALTLEKPA